MMLNDVVMNGRRIDGSHRGGAAKPPALRMTSSCYTDNSLYMLPADGNLPMLCVMPCLSTYHLQTFQPFDMFAYVIIRMTSKQTDKRHKQWLPMITRRAATFNIVDAFSPLSCWRATLIIAWLRIAAANDGIVLCVVDNINVDIVAAVGVH